MGIKQLSDGGPDGTLLGQSTTDKVGFYGLTTPIAKQTVTSVGTTTATTTLNETRLSRLETALAATGLIAMS
jgi:hypothetical protein